MDDEDSFLAATADPETNYNYETDALAGNASPSGYDLMTGGVLAASQNPVDASDNGTLTNGVTGSGTAAPGYVPTSASGSSYSPPGWASALGNITGTVGTVATQVAGIIGGQPATGPGTYGLIPVAGASTVPLPTTGTTSLLFPLVIVAAVLWFIFHRK